MPHDSQNPKWLVLVPTEFERVKIQPQLTIPNSVLETCGFGPIVSAAKTTELIQKHRPDKVLLLGIAGVYDKMLAVGSAFNFSEVSCYGVGAGSGETFLTAEEMGWKHWDANDETDDDSIADLIRIEPLTDIASQLLTVCSAAENRDDVKLRINKFPFALAEDMEGFAVAAACKLAGVPVSIVRGFSNAAGDRDKSNWKIDEALEAAVALCHRRIVEKDLEP
jgi:futalosine hydrolase